MSIKIIAVLMLAVLIGIVIYHPGFYAKSVACPSPTFGFSASIHLPVFRPAYTGSMQFRLPSITAVGYPRFGYPVCTIWDC
ncbi:MAG: hypothetical protein HZB66_01175 [Candidatus Aenigmarchaeota archaeon]|nr:hypothetical protein [Candidatus Aenigmarchaeota archaeon]